MSTPPEIARAGKVWCSDCAPSGNSTPLVEFVLARITEDEERARAVPMPPSVGSVSVGVSDADREAVNEHYGYWMPQRVLLESGIKRKVLAENRGNETLFALYALPYQDHPDLRREWLPQPSQIDEPMDDARFAQ